MVELNKYGMYQMGYEVFKEREKDEIDKHIEFLNKENSLEMVRCYIVEHFGTFEGGKWFEFPDLEKDVYIVLTEEKIEFCAEKRHKQYYGKGWLKLKRDNLE